MKERAEYNEEYKVEPKGKVDGLKHRVSVKVVAFILMIVMGMSFIGTLVSARIMFGAKIFSTEQEVLEEELYNSMTYSSGFGLLSNFLNDNMVYVELACGDFYSLEFQIHGQGGGYESDTLEENEDLVAYEQEYVIGDFYSLLELRLDESISLEEVGDEALWEEMVTFTLTAEDEWLAECIANYVDKTVYTLEEVGNQEYLEATIQTTVYIDESYPVLDEYYFTNIAINWAYSLAACIWQVGILSFVGALVLFAFLLIAAGYRKGHEKRQVCGTARIPYEIFAIVCGTIMVCILVWIEDSYYYFSYYGIYASEVILGILFVATAMIVGMLFLMDLVVRVSTKTIWSNLLIRRIWHWFLLTLRGGNKVGRKIAHGLGAIMRSIPIMWKALVFYGIMSFWLFIMVFVWEDFLRLCMWFLANVIVLPIYGYCCLMFKKMQLGSKALGDGDLNYEVDTKYCVFEFKEMGDSLNSMAVGMEVALAGKMKSERMKTELISNVSHDIKTPLTSIVNYADLISKEETENPKIQEYSQILLKQSDRLKRLTEDLVHASKVTTGNVEVHLAPCDIGVLLQQAIGEYEEKLNGKNLTPITKIPKESMIIKADGRHMWRVFDNLLNNICKYAQEGTRVYMTVEKAEKEVVIEFKNISKYELDISEEELMERFVRGDKSRHSEGNGLGLSIARSLVEVQGGQMSLSIDGDLFKAILRI